METGELVAVGVITGTYGYLGEVKVMPLTDFPQRFALLTRVVLGKDNILREYEIEAIRPYKTFYLFKFKGIDSKEKAGEYYRAYLQVREQDVFPLPEGYYYHFQLKGLAVYDNELGKLGYLTDVLETGANDVYVIESDQYGEILIPAIKDVVLEVNLHENKMQVKLIPGLIDE